jgi:hypothetical protein
VIKQVVKSLICITKDHQFIEIGKCPFTGNQYKMCTRCEEMVTN